MNKNEQQSISTNDSLLGTYKVFEDNYFDETAYLINKFNQRPTELRVREFFDTNELVSLNQFKKLLEQNGIKVESLYRRITAYNKKEKKYYIDWYLFLHGEKIIINIDQNGVDDLQDIQFYLGDMTATEDVDTEFLMDIFKFASECTVKHEDEKRYISIVGRTPFGELTLKHRVLKKVEIPNLDLYYGDGFTEKHKQMLETVNEKDKSGLFIFHGVTGSGKTNYIRYLINQTEYGMNFIFYPAASLREITAPDLITFLADYKNSILIIEESEETVQSREKVDTDKSMISNLLNVTDGLLSDVLNLKIICTFNTDIRNLDKALLREGRLLGIHKFTKISAERATEIAKIKGLDKTFDKDVTLAQIFNNPLSDDLSAYKTDEGTKIGFR